MNQDSSFRADAVVRSSEVPPKRVVRPLSSPVSGLWNSSDIDFTRDQTRVLQIHDGTAAESRCIFGVALFGEFH